jgi:hypothetical protein
MTGMLTLRSRYTIAVVETSVVISCSESGRKSNQFFCGVDLDFLCHNIANPRNSSVALQ